MPLCRNGANKKEPGPGDHALVQARIDGEGLRVGSWLWDALDEEAGLGEDVDYCAQWAVVEVDLERTPGFVPCVGEECDLEVGRRRTCDVDVLDRVVRGDQQPAVRFENAFEL